MLRNLHRLSAVILGSYALFHMANHLFALKGVDAHIRFMDSLRIVYRSPLIEPMLLGCVLYQVASGIRLITERWGARRGVFDRLQAFSGAYLAFFFVAHIGAILYGRIALRLDTNFYFAAAGTISPPFHWFFLPYYFLAVAALFAHLSCALYWRSRARFTDRVRRRLAATMIVLGLLLSTTIVYALQGGFYEIDLPRAYRATFE